MVLLLRATLPLCSMGRMVSSSVSGKTRSCKGHLASKAVSTEAVKVKRSLVQGLRCRAARALQSGQPLQLRFTGGRSEGFWFAMSVPLAPPATRLVVGPDASDSSGLIA